MPADNAIPAGSLPPADVSRETAVAIFGHRLALVEEYARILGTKGVERGLIGPRERSRLWARHVLNCAALTSEIPPASALADVGSGAGLPGLVLALIREDLHVTLVEPMRRRATFLTETVSELALTNVSILCSRADEVRGTQFDVVTARAVAPLPRLVGWCLPLVAPEGSFLAMKGASAATELASAEPMLRTLGAREWSVLSLWAGASMQPTVLVRVRMGLGPSRRRARGGRPAVRPRERLPRKRADGSPRPGREDIG